jgi:hypothetical protein
MQAVVDLISDDEDTGRPPAPRPFVNGEVFDLISSDDDEAPPPAPAAIPAALAKRKASELNEPSDKKLGKRPVAAAAAAADDDEECMEIDQPEAQPFASGGSGGDAASSAAAGASNEEDDDELQFVGRTGQNALSDFPHARENCLESKWRPGAEANACPNCYCFVCDQPASKCPQWPAHCFATHTQDKWRRAREDWKRHAAAGAPMAAAASASASSSSSSSAAAPSSSSSSPSAGRTMVPREERVRWPAEKILKALEQVYPIEEPDPPGLAPGLSLRPYQRQECVVRRPILP